MKEKIRDFELKIYELIGIKHFKKFVLKMHKFLFRKYEDYDTTPSNYKLGRIEGSQTLQNHKKQLYFNGSVHGIALIAALFALAVNIFGTFTASSFYIAIFGILLNLYCVLLQRYNYIRIDRTYKKLKAMEDRQKDKIADELKQDKELIESHDYMLSTKPKKAKERQTTALTFDEFVHSASLKELKQLREEFPHRISDLKYSDISFPIFLDGDRVLKLKRKQQ